MIDGKLLVEKLVFFAKCFLYLSDLDVNYVRNILLKELKLSEPLDYVADLDYIKTLEVPDSLLEEVCDYAVETNIIDEDYRERYKGFIMGIITPRPSEVNSFFKELKEKLGAVEACNYLYNLSIKNNYIQKTAIDKNMFWQAQDKDNILEITINLSKPEKDNKEIAKLLNVAKSNYPKCMLCAENEGFEGRINYPARENLRTISMKLDGEDWFMQYSPYLYYEEHCICISKDHHPMDVNDSTFRKLLDFIDYFPNYFIGSNASLPIVGGSILNHEHFQGGKHLMPMHKAGVLKNLKDDEFPEVEIGIINWYNSAIRLTSANRNQLLQLSCKILNNWKNYDDESMEIQSHTGEIRHNAITPIARKLADGKYCIEIIFRNNRTNETYPDGIFHAHKEYHNIKKEGIGIIEVMGLFILPGRLKKQMEQINDILTGVTAYNKEKINNVEDLLYVHRFMIEELVNKNGIKNDKNKADKIIRDYINDTCIKVLNCTAVFKNTLEGKAGFGRFLSGINIL